MSQFKLNLRRISAIVVVGLVLSACGGSPSITPTKTPLHTFTPGATATQPLVRTMRVDIGGYQLYMRCMGQGNPTVILEAGLGNDITEWDAVQPKVAKFTQVCAYDRANVGQSDRRPTAIKVSAQEIARELHTLLINGHIAGPFILVGHSLGGLFMQMYAILYPGEVAGVVLVDATHPEQTARLAQALGSGWIKLAMQSFPADGITFDDLLAMEAQVDAARSNFPHVPLIVLVRSRFNPPAPWTAQQFQQVWMSLQTELAKLSPKGQLIVAQNSGHDIPNDRPDLVILSIHQVVMQTQ